MKKVDKILLIDDDSIANFVNQHLIKWLELTEELKIVHSTPFAKQEIFLWIEQIKKGSIQSFVILFDAHLDLQKELLPSYRITGLPTIEEDSLLIILATYNKLNNPSLLLRFEGILKKPVTRESLSNAWQKIL